MCRVLLLSLCNLQEGDDTWRSLDSADRNGSSSSDPLRPMDTDCISISDAPSPDERGATKEEEVSNLKATRFAGPRWDVL